MSEKITINQVEQLTGVSKRNIRFYEKEGLLNPERNDANGYRNYGQEDVHRIKVIRILRMLDMPLDEIRDIFAQEQTFYTAVAEQKKRLQEQAKELQAAISFCEKIKQEEWKAMDADQWIREMENAGKEGFFAAWVNDYKMIKEHNADRDFTFTPDGAVTTPQEFTLVLFEYANKAGKNLVITKEGMYPEFELDGVEYTAERFYTSVRGCPIAQVHCFRKDREIVGEGVPKKRKKFIWLVQKWWPVFILLLFNIWFIWKVHLPMKPSLEEWIVPIGLIVVQGAGLYRFYLFHYNDKTENY